MNVTFVVKSIKRKIISNPTYLSVRLPNVLKSHTHKVFCHFYVFWYPFFATRVYHDADFPGLTVYQGCRMTWWRGLDMYYLRYSRWRLWRWRCQSKRWRLHPRIATPSHPNNPIQLTHQSTLGRVFIPFGSLPKREHLCQSSRSTPSSLSAHGTHDDKVFQCI